MQSSEKSLKILNVKYVQKSQKFHTILRLTWIIFEGKILIVLELLHLVKNIEFA